MRGVALNTLFIVLLVITLALITVYYILDSAETEQELGGFTKITGNAQSFEILHHDAGSYEPTEKTAERYDDKFFSYLEHIQDSRDKTFMKGKVFFEEK